MKRLFSMISLLLCALLLAFPASAAAQYANAAELYADWEQNGYPDDVCSVYSTDGEGSMCILLLEDTPEREAELLERLQRIRALLLEVREDLREVPGEVVRPDAVAAAEPSSDAQSAAPAPRGRKARAVVRIDEQTGLPADAGTASGEGTAAKPATRKPRRKKEEPEHQELFAFYEQSLF